MPKPELRLWNADLAKDLGGLEPDPRLWVGGRLMPTAMAATNSAIGPTNLATDVP